MIGWRSCRGRSAVARGVAWGADAASVASKLTRAAFWAGCRARTVDVKTGMRTCASSSAVHFSFLMAGFTLCRHRCAHC